MPLSMPSRSTWSSVSMCRRSRERIDCPGDAPGIHPSRPSPLKHGVAIPMWSFRTSAARCGIQSFQCVLGSRFRGNDMISAFFNIATRPSRGKEEHRWSSPAKGRGSSMYVSPRGFYGINLRFSQKVPGAQRPPAPVPCKEIGFGSQRLSQGFMGKTGFVSAFSTGKTLLYLPPCSWVTRLRAYLFWPPGTKATLPLRDSGEGHVLA